MAGGYSVTISASDKVTPAIDRMTARINKFTNGLQSRVDAISAPTRRVEASFGKLGSAIARVGNVAGLNKVSSGLRGMARYGQDAFQKIGQIVPVLGVITGAASVASMSRMVASWGEWGLKISNASRQMGVGSRQLVAFQGATTLAGGSADAAADGMQNLGQVMYDSVGGRNIQAIEMFNTLRIGFQDMTGHARKAADVMPEIADKIARIRDPFARAQVGVTLFGGAWQGMEPILRLGSKRIAELTAASQRLNPVTDRMIEHGNDLALAQRELGLSVEGLTNRIADQLGPVMTPMLKHLAEWLARSSRVQQAIDWLGRSVQQLGEWLGNIDWDDFGKRAGAWGDRLLHILHAIESWSPPAWLRTALNLPAANTGPNGSASALSSAPSDDPNARPNDGVRGSHPTALGRWLYDNFDRLRGPDNYLHGGASANPQAPNGVPRRGPVFDPSVQTGPVQPSAFANNNPTNLAFYPGQPGLVGRNGRWGVYDTAAHGIGSGFHQMLLDQQKGYGTIASEIAHRSPPGENDTAGMIRDISRWAGLEPNAPLNLQDPDVARRFMRATIRRETGRLAQWDDIDSGIRPYFPGNAQPAAPRPTGTPLVAPSAAGAPLAAPQAQGAPLTLNTGRSSSNNDNDGKSTVRVEFGGKLPDGMSMRVANPQKADIGGPLVERPQLLGAMP